MQTAPARPRLKVADMSAAASVSAELIAKAWDDPRLANVLYHDWEASTYDASWSISYDDRAVKFARDRFVHIAGSHDWPYERSLEIGCGAGSFTLNLARAGVMTSAAVTDISPGMVEVAKRNARGLGFEVEGRVADAERVPFDDAEFDLVIGHSVLHHIPDVEQALREALRVLRPGGRFVFCGEPTKHGDAITRRLSKATQWAMTRAASLPKIGERLVNPPSSRLAELESVVEVHTFDPAQLRRVAVRAGAIDVNTVTEELTAAWFNAPVSTVQGSVAPGVLGRSWSGFAYRGWESLAAFDEHVLDKVVPAGLFNNVCITGTKP